MGYSGNVEPQYIIPTVIGSKQDDGTAPSKRDGLEDLDFQYVLINRSSHDDSKPV